MIGCFAQCGWLRTEPFHLSAGWRYTTLECDTEVRARDLSRADWNFALLSAARGSTASEISEKLGIGEQANIIQSSGLCSKSGVTQNPEYDWRISI